MLVLLLNNKPEQTSWGRI